MAMLCLREKEMLAEKVKGFPVLYDKRVKKGFKEKDAVQNEIILCPKLLQNISKPIRFAQILF